MRAALLALAVAQLCLHGCSPDDGWLRWWPQESATFHRYWSMHAVYLANQDLYPESARARDAARTTIARMPDQQIEWLIRTNYLPGPAANAEEINRGSYVTVGSDWTRYAMPNGSCNSEVDCLRWHRAIAGRLCADQVVRLVKGHISRRGRTVGDRPATGVGIIPFGTVEYRGVLDSDEGEQLSVTWSQDWSGLNDRERVRDPLDDQPHSFTIQHLAGAENWEIASWNGMRDRAPALSRCQKNIAALSARR